MENYLVSLLPPSVPKSPIVKTATVEPIYSLSRFWSRSRGFGKGLYGVAIWAPDALIRGLVPPELHYSCQDRWVLVLSVGWFVVSSSMVALADDSQLCWLSILTTVVLLLLLLVLTERDGWRRHLFSYSWTGQWISMRSGSWNTYPLCERTCRLYTSCKSMAWQKCATCVGLPKDIFCKHYSTKFRASLCRFFLRTIASHTEFWPVVCYIINIIFMYINPRIYQKCVIVNVKVVVSVRFKIPNIANDIPLCFILC